MKTVLFAGALLASVLPSPAFADDAALKSLYEQHVNSVVARNIDAIVDGFSTDAVLITNGGIYEGAEQIRAAYVEYVKGINDGVMASFALDNFMVHGEMVTYQFHVTVDGQVYNTTDSVHFADGKITYLASVDYTK